MVFAVPILTIRIFSAAGHCCWWKETKNWFFYVGITMVRLTILRNGVHHGAVPSTTPVPPLLSHRQRPLSSTILSTTTLAKGAALPRRWEKGSTPKKTHRTTHASPCTTRLSWRRQILSSSSLPIPKPNLRYWKCNSIARLLLCHRFLAAYSNHVKNIAANVSSKSHHTSCHHHSDNNSILHFIETISINIDCKLAGFHHANHHLSTAICFFDPESDENIISFEQHFVSISNELMGKIHNLQITDLLLDDAIARLEFTLFGKDVAIANSEDQQTVPYPSRQHAQTINHPNSSGQATYPSHEFYPASLTSPLYLCGGMDIDTPCNSPWTFTSTSPPLPSPDPLDNDFHGCTSSHPDNDHPPRPTLTTLWIRLQYQYR